MNLNGLEYTLEDEKLLEYMKLTAKEKLIWLEEIQLLTEKALSEEDKEIRARLMRGEI